MRLFVFATAGPLTLVYSGFIAMALREPLGPAGRDVLNALTVMWFLFVLPATALAWFRRWLPLAVTLVIITVWLWASLYVGSKISNY